MTDSRPSLRRVTSTADAAEFLTWLGQRRPVLAIDTEAGGLEWWRQPLRLVQFGDGETAWALSYRQWRGVIEEALCSYEGEVAFHNLPFDRHFIERAGLPFPGAHRAHDTKVLDALLCPGQSHRLKSIGVRMFGAGADEEQQYLKKAMADNGWGWADIPEDYEPYWLYAAKDTVLTALVAEHHLSKLGRLRGPYEIEMAVQAIMYQAERRGMRVDLDYASDLHATWACEIEDLAARLKGEWEIENPGSGDQVAAALVLAGWEPEEWAPMGKPKLDKDVLDGIEHPIAETVKRYKRLVKWSGAYLEHFLREADERGLIHARINTLQAITGRMSISEPPLQQLPTRDGPEIRNCVLPYEGEQLWNLDFSTMEMRVFAHFSQDPALIQAGLEGLDFHKFTASTVYRISIEEVTPNQRAVAKQSVSFGKLYGAGDDKVAKAAKTTLEAVKAFNAMYSDLFPGVEAFMREIVDVGARRRAETGEPYIITWGGRRVPQTDGRLYALVNYFIQGSCSDLFKRKIIEVDAAGYGDHIVLPVHDSLLLSLPPDMADEVPKIKEIMEERGAFRVPLTVSVSGPLARWGDEQK